MNNEITPKSFLDQAQEFQAEIWENEEIRTILQGLGIMEKVDSMCAYVQQLSKDIPRTCIPKPTCPLYAVKDHEGDIVHTTVSTEPQDCIDDWMETEACFRKLANVARHMKGLPMTTDPKHTFYIGFWGDVRQVNPCRKSREICHIGPRSDCGDLRGYRGKIHIVWCGGFHEMPNLQNIYEGVQRLKIMGEVEETFVLV